MITSSEITEKGPQILALVKEAKKILLHLHPRPDGDSVGSSLAMRQVLTEMGKDVTVIKGDSVLPKYLSHLPGFDAIVPKNIFEIDLNEFDLFLIQDAGSIGHVSTLGPIVFPPTLKTVCIDHHVSNEGYAQLNLIDPNFPAVCELLYSLYQNWGVAITHDTALCLMVGIFTDTGGFRYRSVTSRTFATAAALSEVAPDFPDTLFKMDNCNTPGKMAYEGLALSSIHTYLDGRVAISEVSYSAIQEKGIPREEAKAEISNLLKSVTGWEIGISAVEEVSGEVKISMRTRNAEKLDLSQIAVALGGGGHRAAAGVLVKGTLSEVVGKVVAIITDLYADILKTL